jgi:hypothetical protein
MKLTQEHLAAYLPYDVNVFYKDLRRSSHFPNGQVFKLNPYNMGYANQEHLEFKLLLHPIESITKEIEWNGRIIEPFDEICRIKEYAALLYSPEYIIKHPLQLPYDVVQTILSMHIDIFNLIPNNLALCKNK